MYLFATSLDNLLQLFHDHIGREFDFLSSLADLRKTVIAIAFLNSQLNFRCPFDVKSTSPKDPYFLT